MKHFLLASRAWAAMLCGAAALLLSAGAFADPPDRAARLTQIGGTITFSPAGEEDWAVADPNRPVTTGDRIWSDAGSHAEVQGVARPGARQIREQPGAVELPAE